MTRISKFVGPACLAVLLSAASARAADAQPNPEYEGWAKCKVGAMTVIKGNTEAMGQKTSQTITTKLVELTPDKAVVETVMSMEMMGQKMNQPAQKRDVPKTIKPMEMPKPAADQPAMKVPTPKLGKDTVTAAGKTLDCQTSEITMDQNGMTVNAKTWTSTDVPGGMVKMVSTTTGSVASKTTMELVEFKDGK